MHEVTCTGKTQNKKTISEYGNVTGDPLEWTMDRRFNVAVKWLRRRVTLLCSSQCHGVTSLCQGCNVTDDTLKWTFDRRYYVAWRYCVRHRVTEWLCWVRDATSQCWMGYFISHSNASLNAFFVISWLEEHRFECCFECLSIAMLEIPEKLSGG